MKTVNYVIASAFTLLALVCVVCILKGAHHHAFTLVICAIGALLFFDEARNQVQK